MKNSVMMNFNFGNHQLQVEHLSKLGHLNELVGIGNVYRKKNGKPAKRMDTIVNSVWFQEYLELLESDHVNSVMTLKPMITRQGGRKQGTWVHLKLMVRVAIQMNARFADKVIETFITDKLRISLN